MLFGAQRPRVWVFDSFGSQRGHADLWQVYLAHLHRDAQNAIDCGGAGFSASFKRHEQRALVARLEILRERNPPMQEREPLCEEGATARR